MIVRSLLIDVLLVYAVYVPSTARHTLVVAALMTLPLLGCIFIAFRSWDPALHDPPAATWPKGQVGDMAYPATLMSAVWWAIAVAMAAAFSETTHGLRKAVRDVRRLGRHHWLRRTTRGSFIATSNPATSWSSIAALATPSGPTSLSRASPSDHAASCAALPCSSSFAQKSTELPASAMTLALRPPAR